MHETVVADIQPHMRSAFAFLAEEQQVARSQVSGRQSARLSALPTGGARNTGTGAGVTVMHQATTVETTGCISPIAIRSTDNLQGVLGRALADGDRIRCDPL